LPQFPQTESVEKTQERAENIEKLIRQMEENSDTESECESAEQLQVDESYKSNSDLKKITKNARKSKRAVKNLEDVKQKLSEGINPMEIGYKPTNLGNGFYYIRKPNARIIVKVDPTTGNSTLEDDDSKYWLEITTPQALASHMDERKQRFLEPLYPFIIVRELTSAVIKEAIEAFIIEEEEGFWFKLYYSIPYLTIDDLNLIIDRRKKEMQAEEEEDKEED